MSIRLDQLGAAGRRRAIAQLDALEAAERGKRGAGSPDAAKRAKAAERGQEAELQRECEGYLKFRGYVPRTPKYLDAGPPARGWFVHMAQAQGNPLVLDLLVIDLTGRCLEIELKAKGGRLRRHQKQLLEQAPAFTHLVYSVDELVAILNAWEEAAKAESSSPSTPYHKEASNGR